jgi:GMP synthase (glutamine-hydrolysing)
MIIVLDFGSQTSQLIARRLREAQVFCQLFAWDTPADEILALKPQGYVLSGGPASVYEAGAPQLPEYVIESGKPVLGICYGMQALTRSLGGSVAASQQREFGSAQLRTIAANPLLPSGEQTVWMSHGDRIEHAPDGFTAIGATANAPVAAMANVARGYFGVQFHPEVHHTPGGSEILRRFAVDICGATPDWSPGAIVEPGGDQWRARFERGVGAGARRHRRPVGRHVCGYGLTAPRRARRSDPGPAKRAGHRAGGGGCSGNIPGRSARG